LGSYSTKVRAILNSDDEHLSLVLSIQITSLECTPTEDRECLDTTHIFTAVGCSPYGSEQGYIKYISLKTIRKRSPFFNYQQLQMNNSFLRGVVALGYHFNMVWFVLYKLVLVMNIPEILVRWRYNTIEQSLNLRYNQTP
jgi:hypothetical protein